LKLLIIGSGGFIGRHVYDYFSRAHEVVGCDVFQTDQKNFYLITDSSFDFVFSSEDIDVCINCSGNGNVSLSIENPDYDYALNTRNVFILLNALRTYSPTTKLINLSSAAVYGNPKTLPVTEAHEVNPLSPYGWNKYQSEVLMQEYFAMHEIPSLSLRVFSVYGEGLRKQLFWDTYQKYLQNSKEIILFGDGTESRDFIYVEDLCLSLDKVIQHAVFNGTVINVASGIETTIKDAVTMFMAAVDSNCKLTFNQVSKPGDPKNWRADITQLKKFGFAPVHSFQDSIQRVAEWVLREKK
jgi:UDP-glucose 4-epimerase